MRLKNKKTGEIGKLKHYNNDKRVCVWIDNVSEPDYIYNSLAELNEEWEDMPEEPKEYWFIDYDGGIIPFFKMKDTATDKLMKQIGNYFETREEAEKAVKKLEAWKRLKEAGFKFGGWTHTPITKSLTGYNLHIKAYSDVLADYMDDLQEVFGGEE